MRKYCSPMPKIWGICGHGREVFLYMPKRQELKWNTHTKYNVFGSGELKIVHRPKMKSSGVTEKIE